MQPTVYQNLQALLHYNNSVFSPNNIKTVIIGPDGVIVGYHINKIMAFKPYTVQQLMQYHSDTKAKPLLRALHDGIQFPSVEEVIILMPTNQNVFRPQDFSPASLVRNSSFTLEGLRQDYKRLRYFTVVPIPSINVMSGLYQALQAQKLDKPGLAPKSITDFIREFGLQPHITEVHTSKEYFLDNGISIKSRETYPEMDGAQGELNLYFQKVKSHLQAQLDKADSAAKTANEKQVAMQQAENLEKFCEVMKVGVLNSKIPENMIYKTFNTKAYDSIKDKVYHYPKFTEKVQSVATPLKYMKEVTSEVIKDITRPVSIKLKASEGETVKQILEGDISLAKEVVRRLKALVDVNPDDELNAFVRRLGSLAPKLTISEPILVERETFLRLDSNFEYTKANNNLCAYKKDNQTGIVLRTPIFEQAVFDPYDLVVSKKQIIAQYAQLVKYLGKALLTGVINLNAELDRLNLSASRQAIPNDMTIKQILLDHDNLFYSTKTEWNPDDNLLLFTLIAENL